MSLPDPKAANHIIIMTRFPEPGKTKTRLIPALGPVRAAALHHDLITHTLNIVHRSASLHQWQAEVRYFGGDEQQFREQFGTQLNYVPQSEGTLGDRMNAAVAAAFQDGAGRVIVIGTDCPLLDESHLTTAFEHLANHDIVVGPATDGGYYLIGMRKHLPSLFDDISWGTEAVFKQTLARGKFIGVSPKVLTSLSDVDYIEDLIHCRQIEETFRKALPQTTTGRISVIIPTWNEAENISHTLRQFRNVPVMEIIVADGGSTDNTVALAQAAGAHVISCNPGRGKQMNAGAAMASGEVLLFLHADTQLPYDFSEHIWRAMNSGHSGGAFRLQIDAPGWMLRIVEFGANLRSQWLKLPYGDQAIFVRASAFFQMNGFQPWPLMEDFDFCRRLKQIGKMAIMPVAATTSARRWKRLGVLRTTLTNFACVIAFQLGISPATLADWHRRR